MAAVVTIAMTLIAGAALFGYVNGQAANSESNLGQANAANVNFLSERETITLVNFPSSTQLNVWIYNSGTVDLSGFTILVSGPIATMACTAPPGSAPQTCNPPNACAVLSGPSAIPHGTQTNPSSPQSYTIDIGGCAGKTFGFGTYTITFQGQFGSIVATTKGN